MHINTCLSTRLKHVCSLQHTQTHIYYKDTQKLFFLKALLHMTEQA